MSKFFDFLNTSADKLHDFFGTHGGVLPPLPADKHWFGAENDSNEKRRALYELNRKREANLAYEKKRQEELRQWNADKAAGKGPRFLSQEQFNNSPEGKAVISSPEFLKKIEGLDYDSERWQTDGALFEAYDATEWGKKTLEDDDFYGLARKVKDAHWQTPPLPKEHQKQTREGAQRFLTQTNVFHVSQDHGALFNSVGAAGSHAVQLSGKLKPGTVSGQQIFLGTIHGGADGTLHSHWNGAYNSDGWTQWSDESLEELNRIKDLYLNCCSPAQVQKRYPFLSIQNSGSTLTTNSSTFEHGGNGYDGPRRRYEGAHALFDEMEPEALEIKTKLAPHGMGALDEASEIDLVTKGKKPLYMGSSPTRLLNDLADQNPKDVYLRGTIQNHFERDTGHGGWALRWNLDNPPPNIEVEIGSLVPGASNASEYLYGPRETVDKAIEIIKKHAEAGTEGTAEYHKEIGKALGYTDEAIDLHNFVKSKYYQEALDAGFSYPLLGRGPERKASMYPEEALRFGFSPRDIHEQLAKQAELFYADVPTELLPGGKSLKNVETGIERAVKAINKHGKTFGIIGLIGALGIGLPAVASASTGASPTDGGLGSTLAIAGTATAAGVGAYLFAKIGTTGAAAAGAAGGAAGGGAGAAGAAGAVNRNTGSRIYNSSFVQNELDLTTRGFFAGLGSVINDFGFNRRTGSFDTSGAPDSFIDSLFGKSLKGDGYVHPVYRKEEAFWKVAHNIDDAYQGWKDYINTSYRNSSGISKLFQGVRYHGFRALDSVGDGWLNKQLVKAGGFSTVVAPALMAHGALSDFKEGYRRGGLIGGALKTVTGLISGLVQNKVIAGILLNPLTGLLGAGITAAAGYAAFKIFDVRNEGANYIRSGRMGGLSWNRGPTPGMSGSMAATARQRALNSMNNSKFNAMKAMGNESYMMNVPKSRYANSTGIHGITPVLSY